MKLFLSSFWKISIFHPWQITVLFVNYNSEERSIFGGNWANFLIKVRVQIFSRNYTISIPNHTNCGKRDIFQKVEIFRLSPIQYTMPLPPKSLAQFYFNETLQLYELHSALQKLQKQEPNILLITHRVFTHSTSIPPSLLPYTYKNRSCSVRARVYKAFSCLLQWWFVQFSTKTHHDKWW